MSKNLITEGTIEEFEAVFKDKFVRKTMKTTKKTRNDLKY